MNHFEKFPGVAEQHAKNGLGVILPPLPGYRYRVKR